MNLLLNLKFTLGSLLVAGLVACGGGGGGAGSGNGSLRLALTDAPACGYDAVHVTILKVRVHSSDTASDGDAGWSEVVLNPAKRVDLLKLTNGVLEELGQTPLPVGKYTQLRLVLAANDLANPLANSVVPAGGTEVALKTPSGQQSGLKTNIDIDIASNRMADFILDFDACKSVVTAGASGQYLLKPVLTVIPRYISAVSGYVATSINSTTATVSLQKDGVVVKAANPDLTGRFLLQPVAPGVYTLVMTAPGRTTVVVTNVAVSADMVTAVNTSGTPLNPPTSASGTVTGSAPVDTLVRVLQPLTSGPSIEIAGRFADGSTGVYSYLLAVNAPLVAPYAAAPIPLAFVADITATGKYVLSASLTGFAGKSIVLGSPLTAGATVTNNFTFP